MIWEEEIVLEDGERIFVRPVRPSDRPTFEKGWAAMSERSRLFRFLGPRRSLTEHELAYLTDVDGIDHFALGAVTRDAEGDEGPVAVARLVRREDRPREAEFAITVVDAFQHRGVGEGMFRRLLEAARRRGIDVLHACVHPENVRAVRLIERVTPQASSVTEGSLLRYLVPLASDPGGEAAT